MLLHIATIGFLAATAALGPPAPSSGGVTLVQQDDCAEVKDVMEPVKERLLDALQRYRSCLAKAPPNEGCDQRFDALDKLRGQLSVLARKYDDLCK